MAVWHGVLHSVYWLLTAVVSIGAGLDMLLSGRFGVLLSGVVGGV